METKKEWTDERKGGSGDIHNEEIECCEGNACCIGGGDRAQSKNEGDPTDV